VGNGGFALINTIGNSSRVARFFLVQHTRTGKNTPNDQKIYPKGHKL
jgi:hypothetical protein